MIARITAAALAAVVLAAAASATNYRFDVNSAASTADPNVSGSNTFTGTWKGNYDPNTNPTGTRTIQGGGSSAPPRNDNVPFSGSDTIAGSASTHPDGAFSMSLNTAALTVQMSGVSIDLLNGVQPALALNASILYSSFQTAAPTSFYPGGTPIPIPLGSVTLTGMTLTSAGPAVGTLTPAGGGSYNFSVIGPFTVTTTATYQGSPLALQPLTGPLALTGTVTPNGATAAATLTAVIDASGQQTQPVPGPTDAPFDLPTVLPPGSVAHLLVTMTFQTGSLSLKSSMNLVAAGVLGCEGDTDGDGDVDQDDIDTVLFNYGTLRPPGTNGDVDGNGQVNQDDIDAVLFNYGCA